MRKGPDQIGVLSPRARILALLMAVMPGCFAPSPFPDNPHVEWNVGDGGTTTCEAECLKKARDITWVRRAFGFVPDSPLDCERAFAPDGTALKPDEQAPAGQGWCVPGGSTATGGSDGNPEKQCTPIAEIPTVSIPFQPAPGQSPMTTCEAECDKNGREEGKEEETCLWAFDKDGVKISYTRPMYAGDRSICYDSEKYTPCAE